MNQNGLLSCEGAQFSIGSLAPMKSRLWLSILALWLFAPALVPTGAVLQADDRFGNRETTRVIQTQAVTAIANLADPAKLATLGERGAIPRVKKITYWLLAGQNVGAQPAAVIDAAFDQFGWKGTRQGEVTKTTMLLNVARARNLELDDAENMERMRGGKAPAVRRGPFIGQIISVDHVLPFAKYPELDNVLANLELMPLQMNEEKSASIGDRQIQMEKRLRWAGLLDASTAPITAPPPVAKPAVTAATSPFAGSSRSPVFHKTTCPSVAKIVPSNLVFYPTRGAATAAGKRPCPSCNP